MKTKRAGVRAILTQIEQSADRSSLFHWMVEHHDELLAKAKGRKMRWVELSVTFGRLGLTNQQGEIATERTARETWYRARKEVARLHGYAARRAATGLSGRRLLPSAAPASWQPTPTPQGSTSSAGQSLPAGVSGEGTLAPAQHSGEPGMTVGQARLAALRQALNERSGR